MPHKVAVLNQGYIPHYRLRFYELLARRDEDIYVVFHGSPPSWVGVPAVEGPFAFSERRVRNREIRIGSWIAIYQPVLREILTGGYDAVVVGNDLKFLSSLLLAILGKMRGLTVIYWDFGYHPVRGFSHRVRTSRPVVWGATLVKKALTRLAHGYLAYTRAGAERLAADGYPRDRIFVLHNTIDMTEQRRWYDQVKHEDPQPIRRKYGLRDDSVVFVYLGRLVEFKRVDLLIEAVRRINRQPGSRPVEALIVGAGPLERSLRDSAADVPEVHFLGALPAGEEVARCLKIAAAAVIPGAVGLAVNHAFAHGRPMITGRHELHGPEIEYVSNDENGLVIAGGIAELTDALRDFANSPEAQRRLAEGALRAAQQFRIEAMVEQFDKGVRATIARHRHGRPHPGTSLALSALISTVLT